MRPASALTSRHLLRGLALAVGIAAAPAVAAGSPPAHPPVPAPKPATEKAVPKPQPDRTAPPVPEKRPPPPAAKDAPAEISPGEEGGTDSEKPPQPETETEETKPVPIPGIGEDGAALAACYGKLDALGVVYQKKGTVNDDGDCGMEAPISVSSILPGVTLKPDAEMRCATAAALADWTRRVVEPAAEELGTNVRLTGLTQGSAYVCKHRDGEPDRKISQHAFGNAVDIVTFRFDGHPPLSIAPRTRTGKIEEGFQRAVIGGACLYFTTVLGPRADSYHQDNLHLDIDRRSHGFRLCQ